MSNSESGWSLTSVYRSLFLLGGGLAFAGERFSWPVLTNLALLCLALLMVLIGGELIITKRAEFAIGGWAYIQARETFKGLAAQLWGVMFLGLGLVAALLTLAKWIIPAATDSFWSRLQGTPAGAGLALMGLGMMAALYGFIRLLAGSAGVNLGRLTAFANLMDRIGGAVILLAGLALISTGLLLAFAPNTVFAVVDQVKAAILHRL
jgi:hypothetical protein